MELEGLVLLVARMISGWISSQQQQSAFWIDRQRNCNSENILDQRPEFRVDLVIPIEGEGQYYDEVYAF